MCVQWFNLHCRAPKRGRGYAMRKLFKWYAMLWLPIDGGWQFPFRKMDSMNLQKKIQHQFQRTFYSVSAFIQNIPTSCMEMSTWMVRLLPPPARTSHPMRKKEKCELCAHNYSSRIRHSYRSAQAHLRRRAHTFMFAYGRMRCNKNDANTIQINRVFDAYWEGRQQLNQLRYSFRIRAYGAEIEKSLLAVPHAAAANWSLRA